MCDIPATEWVVTIFLHEACQRQCDCLHERTGAKNFRKNGVRREKNHGGVVPGGEPRTILALRIAKLFTLMISVARRLDVAVSAEGRKTNSLNLFVAISLA